jgi:tetratricopeptide (TPR) repeat protein
MRCLDQKPGIYDGRVRVLALVVAALVVGQPDVREMARLAQQGWQQARAAATAAGSPESLVPARETVALLDKLEPQTKWPLQLAYARTLIAAAIAASQDERAEMSLQLEHARALSERLKTSAWPATSPLPIDEAEGELRLEVDEYAEAMTAFERALPHATRAAVWIGYGRSAARLEKRDRACYAYRRALLLQLSPVEREEALDYAVRCR